MARYKTYKIENTPSEKFPQMVTISKKIKGNLFEKKFISDAIIANPELIAASNFVRLFISNLAQSFKV